MQQGVTILKIPPLDKTKIIWYNFSSKIKRKKGGGIQILLNF
jgi:hypothetical protein